MIGRVGVGAMSGLNYSSMVDVSVLWQWEGGDLVIGE